MLYYFVVSVDNKKYHEEFFEGSDQDAVKYMAYKEQSIREVINCFKSEKERLIIFSNFYTSDVKNIIDYEKVDSMEKNLIEMTRKRGELIELIHKLK